MPRIVITHDVQDVERWLRGKAERAAAFPGGRNVTDLVASDGSNRAARGRRRRRPGRLQRIHDLDAPGDSRPSRVPRRRDLERHCLRRGVTGSLIGDQAEGPALQTPLRAGLEHTAPWTRAGDPRHTAAS
jgi:hypothetical protein